MGDGGRNVISQSVQDSAKMETTSEFRNHIEKIITNIEDLRGISL